MSILQKLFRKSSEPDTRKPQMESPYVTQWYVYGMHLYRTANEDSTVWYVDENRGVRELLVDRYGKIQNFPGIHMEDFWVKEVAPNYLKPQIRFRTEFEKRDGRIVMLWQIQPDGRYWEDEDGFGAENDMEVMLRASLNAQGKWDGPFRIYRMGSQYFDSRDGKSAD